MNSVLEAFIETAFDGSAPEDVTEHSVVICSATKNAPVICVSEAFEAHTGYAPAEVMGKSLSILQGAKTAEEAVNLFRYLIKNGRSGTVRILNYRRDGSEFIHECEFRPIRGTDGKISHFLSIQRPV